MEVALAAGYIHEPPPTIKPNYPNANKTLIMAAPPSIQETNLATPKIINTDLPPTPGDHSANESSHTMDEVGRWDQMHPSGPPISSGYRRRKIFADHRWPYKHTWWDHTCGNQFQIIFELKNPRMRLRQIEQRQRQSEPPKQMGFCQRSSCLPG
jgi:hypothetical protein